MKRRSLAQESRILALVFDADKAHVPSADDLDFAVPLAPATLPPGYGDGTRCFLHTSFRRVVEGIRSSIRNGAPVVVATGEAGCGKTVLAQCLMDYPAEGVIPLVFDNRQATFEEFLYSACRHFRLGGTPIEREGSFSERFRVFWDYLLSQRARGRSVMIVADDAHSISEGLLGELALLSECAKDGKPVLQMVLVGLPSVHKLLDSLVVRGFIKKKYPTFELTPLKSGDIGLFIDSQISALSDGPRLVFSPQSVDKIAAYSRGVPRSILALCSVAVFKAKLEKRGEITGDLIEEALLAVDQGQSFDPVRRRARQEFRTPPGRTLAVSAPPKHDKPGVYSASDSPLDPPTTTAHGERSLKPLAAVHASKDQAIENPQQTDECGMLAASEPVPQLPEFAEACSRGRELKRHVLEAIEMLSEEAFADRASLTLDAVTHMRYNGSVLALPCPPPAERFVFPSWQLDSRIWGWISQVLHTLGDLSPWAKWHFFFTSSPILLELSPMETLGLEPFCLNRDCFSDRMQQLEMKSGSVRGLIILAAEFYTRGQE